MPTQNIIWLGIYAVLIAGSAWALWRYWDFLKSAYQELRHKVTWPGWQEVQGTTIVVLITTMIFAFYLFMCDVVLQKTIMGLLRWVHGVL